MDAPLVWHQLPVEAVLRSVGSGRAGLAPDERSRRQREYGPNELRAAGRVSAWATLAAQFRSVLIGILLLAAALSAALGHGLEAAAIAVILLLAVALGFAQEYRAERAIEALRELSAPAATVLVAGEELRIPARDLVPGDVLALRAGDRVPADARVIESVNLQVEEASLTGESLPSAKQSADLAGADLALGDRANMIYAGTAVSYGRGLAVVVATGMETEFGRITGMLQGVQVRRTPLQENLDHVGAALAKGAAGIVALVVALGLLRGEPPLELFIFAIALAVAVVPEALPAVVTVSLALGVQRMARRHALVRRLPTVETLGSTTVICADKTGTLTSDAMTVREIAAGGERFTVTGAGYGPAGDFFRDGRPIAPAGPLADLLRAAALCSDARLLERGGGWQVAGDATEGALVAAAAKAGLRKAALEAEAPRVQETPFTAETRRMTTVHRRPDGLLICAKGAPEVILEACDREAGPGGPAALDDDRREEILAEARAMAGRALRVLAVAQREGAAAPCPADGLTFLGLAGMIDPPRPEARAAIATCAQAGIRPVMITGDHPLTAQAVARELGLLTDGRLVTGAELDRMGDEELAAAAEAIQVYARVSPAHKLRVVTALQRRGQIVAMTGDGVNDAPALKRADIGVAMGLTGTDVSKEAAAITLTDDNFASIVAAVEEGRAIFGNIKKYLMYLLASNIGEIGLMTGAALLGLPLPLTAVQILYVNLATDGLPALALALDPAEPDLLRRPPRNPRRGIFTRPVVALMLVGGLWSTLANLALFAWALAAGRPQAEAMTLTFVSLVLTQLFAAYLFRSDRRSALRRPFANRWLNLAVLWELLALAAVVSAPLLAGALGAAPLAPADWLIALGVAASSVPALELAKWAARRGWLGEAG